MWVFVLLIIGMVVYLFSKTNLLELVMYVVIAFIFNPFVLLLIVVSLELSRKGIK